jgi:hypothetical protein
MMAFRVDNIQRKLHDLEKFLAENEWIFLENAERMKTIRNIEREVDMESFNMTCNQIVRFSRYIDKVSRALSQVSNECDAFNKESDLQ